MLSWRVGEIEIIQLVELTTASLGPHLIPQARPDYLSTIPWMIPFLDSSGQIILSVHSLIIKTNDQTIVVDTCIGNDKERSYPKWNKMQSDFMNRFTDKAGCHRSEVDTVLCTHMHVDHVGWNTYRVDDQWMPTFSNAEYLFSEREWDYWKTEKQSYGPVIEDSITPIFEAKMARLVKSDHRISDEVSLFSTPGHTPGHVSVRIVSKGEEAIITGDMIHHPCQIKHPDWATSADVEADRAVSTRTHFLENYAGQPTLIIGTHFAGPGAGRIVRDGSSFRLDY